MTLQDSLSSCQPFVKHAPTQKVLAKQWLQMYQYGPFWVIPLVWPGAAANSYLAWTSPRGSTACLLYAAATLIYLAVLPMTFFYMEPGVNGAAKWKVQSLLKDEGFSMPDGSIFRPSAQRHAASRASRRWAERVEMKDIVQLWVRINNVRWVMAAVSAGLSGYATLS